MSTIRITKEFRFEGAHALKGYDGKCSHIHGHSYRLFVTIIGKPNSLPGNPKEGMVMDFGALKELVQNLIVEPFDHALLLRNDSTLAEELQNQYKNVHLLPFQPTCEHLCIHFASLLVAVIKEPVHLFSIRLYETLGSFAEWFATDNL